MNFWGMSFYWDWWRIGICRSHRAFLSQLAPADHTPNPLPILSRAINRVCRAFNVRVPRWRRGRWRAKT